MKADEISVQMTKRKKYCEMYDLAQNRFEMIKSLFLIVTINLNILRSFHCVKVLGYDPHFQDPE